MSMFGFLSHGLFTHHASQSTSGLSPALWRQVTNTVNGAGSADGVRRLYLVGDDFSSVLSDNTSTNLYTSDGFYESYIDTGGTLAQLADESGGVLALNTDGTDNDQTWLAFGDSTNEEGILGKIDNSTAALDMLTAFEVRFKKGSIGDNATSCFLGLGKPDIMGNDGMTDDTAVMKNDDFIGFHCKADDGDSLDFSFKATGQTVQDHIEGVHTLVADTFVKAGFVYDPAAPADRRIKVYIDNVEKSTYVTETQVDAATFPEAEFMTFLAGVMNNDGSTSGELAIDWWAFAQVMP